MKSLKELYRIGHGPSSSHTMGPKRAADIFGQRNPAAQRFEITLYGALAATGRGHLTDKAILESLTPVAPATIDWRAKEVLPLHTNGMEFRAYENNNLTDSWQVYSVGGGALKDEGNMSESSADIYPLSRIADIMAWCDDNQSTYWEYVEQCEGAEIWDYLAQIWEQMKLTIENGLQNEGILPGGLRLRRKAANYLVKSSGYSDKLNSRGKIYAYALAAMEENASGGVVVTAPTCGSCGVLPSVLYHLQKSRDFSDKRILRALATAGIFGNVAKTNASISGAEVGCQGEVGVACAMAAAAACQIFGGTPQQIEYAAEIGLEHHLGLTCDPVCGLVQIPCIERNALAAARALDANLYATLSDGKHMISYDRVVEVMKETGHNLPSLYKETSEGGLAKNYQGIRPHDDDCGGCPAC